MQVISPTTLISNTPVLSFTEADPKVKLQFGPTSDPVTVGIHTFIVTATLLNFQEMDAIMAAKSSFKVEVSSSCA